MAAQYPVYRHYFYVCDTVHSSLNHSNSLNHNYCGVFFNSFMYIYISLFLYRFSILLLILRPAARVGHQVHPCQVVFEVPRLRAPPRTQVARVGLLPRVRAHVAGQFRRPHERSSAQAAGAVPAQPGQHANPSGPSSGHASAWATQLGKHLREGDRRGEV